MNGRNSKMIRKLAKVRGKQLQAALADLKYIVNHQTIGARIKTAAKIVCGRW